MASRIDEAFAFQQKALNLRAYRQQVLASNIANADTPNYQARDFNFSAVLQDALAGRSTGDLALNTTSAAHFSGTGMAGSPALQYRQPMQASGDGNTVEMDVERGQFAENAVHYEAGLTFITHQIKQLSAALQSAS